MNNAATSHRRSPVPWLIGGAFLLALAVTAGVLAWNMRLKDRIVPKRWGVVEEGTIFRSGQLPASLLKIMAHRHHIRRIVDLTFSDPSNVDQQSERKMAEALGIQYLNYPLYGSGIGDIWNYAHAMAVMACAKKERKPVLVHCSAGTQRTGGVVAAYRILIEKKPPAIAYAELVRYGWTPTEDQLLLDFLNSHMEELAERLREMQLIDAVPDPLPVIGP